MEDINICKFSRLSLSNIDNTMSTWGYNKDNGELTNFYYLIKPNHINIYLCIFVKSNH